MHKKLSHEHVEQPGMQCGVRMSEAGTAGAFSMLMASQGNLPHHRSGQGYTHLHQGCKDLASRCTVKNWLRKACERDVRELQHLVAAPAASLMSVCFSVAALIPPNLLRFCRSCLIKISASICTDIQPHETPPLSDIPFSKFVYVRSLASLWVILWWRGNLTHHSRCTVRDMQLATRSI